MLISDFDYDLPDELIAQYPATERRDSRLLAVADGFEDRLFADLPVLLRRGDLLVLNDTRVIKARLHAVKETGGRAEILVERVTGERTAIALLRASKTPITGSRVWAASTPARWAAWPAPAMITLIPFFMADPANSVARCGLLWAEATVMS